MTRIRRRLSLVALVGLAGTTGCSLFWSTSDFTSHDDDAASTPEAGAAADAAPSSSGDGSTVLGDASAPDSGATGGTFCGGLSPTPAFCVDFDTASPAGFDLVGAKCSPPVVETGSGTAGSALATTIPASTECTSDGEWSGGGTFTKFRATFAVRQEADALAYTQVYSFLFKSGATVHRILVAYNQGTFDFIQELDYASSNAFANVPLAPATGYIPVTLEGSCASKSITLTVAGKVTQASLNTAPSGSCAEGNVRFGVYYNAPTQKPKKVWFDDVALWLQ